MFRTRRHWSVDLAVAVLCAVAAAGARTYLSRAFGEQVSVLVYIPAIAFSAWLGGFIPGVVTTLLSAAAHLFLPHEIPRPIAVDPRAEEIRVGLLIGTGILISSLHGGLRVVGRALERRYDHARLMLEAAQRLSGTLVVEQVHDELRMLVQRALTLDGMIISAYDPDTHVARCVYGWVNGRRFDHTLLPPLTLDPNGKGMQTEVVRTGKARLFADVRARVKRPGRYYDVDPTGRVKDLKKPESGPPGSRCAMMAPLKLEGRVVGIVQVMSDTRGVYRRRELAVLEAIVAPIAVALQNAELYARAKREIAERLRVEHALTLSEERLLEADRRKDEFLATLAHELRNPLAAIRGAGAVLRHSVADRERVAWSGEVIERQVRHMSRLLDDLLDVSRVSRGSLRLRRERVDLAEIVRQAVEASQPAIEGGSHRLTLDLPAEPLRLDADGTRIAQVVSNLLNNAARYSASGSPITLAARAERDEAVLRVVDQGIGIPEAMLPRIFEAFLQVDRSWERSQGGLGIGLSLVKQIVELHGGRVSARSEGPGKGSEFTVRLPLAVEVPAGGEREGEGTGERGGERTGARGESTGVDPAGVPGAFTQAIRRVLVADDLEDSATSLAMLLRMRGHEVRTARDGDEAVRVARSFQPDVVLLDIAMPKLNGYEAAQRILADQRENRPVLIALTGWGHEEKRIRTREAGFDHHLVKPVEPDVLYELLSRSNPQHSTVGT